MSRITLFLGIALFALSNPGLADKFYKWVDDNGVTHYGTQAPNDRDASEVNTRANASSDQDQALEALNAKREAKQQAKITAEKKAKQQERLEKEPEAVVAERCKQHRENLETLQNKPVVRTQNPETGEMEVLDQEARDKMIEDTEAALQKCEQQQ